MQLDQVAPGLGIELFILDASKTEPASDKQSHLWNGKPSADSEQVAELLDNIAARVGTGKINRYLPDEHHWPERAAAPTTDLSKTPESEWNEDCIRPVQLLKPPEPIEAMALTPDYAPRQFVYRGERHIIVNADGPGNGSVMNGGKRMAAIAITMWLKTRRACVTGFSAPLPTLPGQTRRWVYPWLFPMSYAELQVTSNFSFRLGGSHPEELVDAAADLGYSAIAVADRNTFAGVVRAYVVAKDRAIKFIPAVRLDLLDGPSLLAYPTDQAAYSRLSGLLTLGNLRAEKEKCYLYKARCLCA